MPAEALYVAFDVYPRPKGSTSHISSMLKALENEFGGVLAICLGDGDLPEYSREGVLEIYRFPAWQFPDLLDRATAFARFVEGHVSKQAESLRLIVYRDPWGGVPAMRAAAGCPSIFEVNALPSWELAYSRPGFLESPTLAAKLGDLERTCLRASAGILCVSQVTRRALANEGVDPQKISVIANSAAQVFFDGPLLPCPSSELTEADGGTKWIGYIGGLQPWQGVEDLIDGFALIAPGFPQARLLILHSGSRDTRPFERQIQRHHFSMRVFLHDPLAAEELAGTIARLHCTVAPLAETPRNTHQGCCPVKIVESMAAGTPVIASDLEVCRELIRHGEDGWLVPPGDHRALAFALERLLSDALLRDRLAAEAKRTAHERFGQPNAHEDLRRVFRRLSR